MDALVFGLKCMSWREAMDMSLVDIDVCYERAVAWAEARNAEADTANRRGRR